MKKFMSLLVFCGFITCSSFGQDLWKTNPKECVVLHDTLGVKMMLVTLVPGASLAPHTHGTFQFYVLEGGEIQGTPKGGVPAKAMYPAGAHIQAAGMGVHGDKNVGATTVKFLLVEIEKLKN